MKTKSKEELERELDIFDELDDLKGGEDDGTKI